MSYHPNIFALLPTLCILLFPAIIQGQDVQTTQQKVKTLLGKMTLEEKIGQMNQYNGFWDFTGPLPENGDIQKKYQHLRSGLVGSMLNVRGVENVRKIQKIAVEDTRLGIPLIFGFDVIHGFNTASPIPLGEAASWDLKAIEASAAMAAREASAEGINWTFAPMVDITRDARWGRVMEGAGEDPYLGSRIAEARVRGFQGRDFSDNHHVIACAKHFAGYGFAESGKDYNTVDIGTSTLFNAIFPPFKACVDAGVRTFMNAFNDLNGIPATSNHFLQRDILKGRWAFDGFVVSDWGSIREMIDHRYAEDLKDASKKAALAGCDMDLESHGYVTYLKNLVENGDVPLTVIDDAVSRILRVKFEIGLFDNPYKYCDEKNEKEWRQNKIHDSIVLDMAKKSMVLLKNEKQLLPLPEKGKKIALVGDLAFDKHSILGNWSLAVKANSAVSVFEGMQKYSGNTLIAAAGPALSVGEETFFSELTINQTDTTGWAAVLQAAKSADVVVMVLGEHGLQSGEGRSRANLGLPGLQQALLEAVHAVNPSIVLVLMNGRPLTLNWASEHIPAILVAWQPGSQGGHAVAEVLYGDYNPSGKLPMTFPRSEGQMPVYYNHKSTGRPGPKKEVFWSHYTDEDNSPLYPFGYGLSYSTFEYKNLEIQTTGTRAFTISVEVKNTGSFAGEEVVQLYLTDKVASVTRPVKELKGFEKIMLKPGETKIVHFLIGEKELGFYDENGTFIVEPGEFEVMIGGSSHKGLKGTFRLND